MGPGLGTAAFLALPAPTIPAVLLPWHPALEPSSPPKAPVPPGALWVLAAPWAGSGTLCARQGTFCSQPRRGGTLCPGRAAGPWSGLAGAVLGPSSSGENEADFIKQSCVLEAGGVFHCSLRVRLALFFSWLQNTTGLVPVWIPPVLLQWELGRGESLSELKREEWAGGRGTLSLTPPIRFQQRRQHSPGQLPRQCWAGEPAPPALGVPVHTEPGSSALLSCWVLPNPVLPGLFRKPPVHWDIWGFASQSQAKHSRAAGGVPVSPLCSQGRLLRGKEEPQGDRDRGGMSDVPPCGVGSPMHSQGHPPPQATP